MMATMAAVLSEDNQALLRLIRDRRPKPLTALANLTGQRVPNLSRSLRMMEGYSLVKLKRDGHGVEPVALATGFKILDRLKIRTVNNNKEAERAELHKTI